MRFSLNLNSLEEWRGTVLLTGLFEDELTTGLEPLDKLCEASLSSRLNSQNFKGKKGELIHFHILKGSIEKLLIVGLGAKEDLRLEDLRQAAAKGARACTGFQGSLGVFLPWEIFSPEISARAVGESIQLSFFKDLRFRSKPEPITFPENIELIGIPEEVESSISLIAPICSGVNLARELVGAPPNELTPSNLAKEAGLIAKEHGLKINILNKEACKKKNMGAYLAVAKGSDLEPNFIHMIYQPNKTAKHRIALVGKGLTFDSGGYNLKVGASQIELMKFDMGGSAAVLGTARAIGELKPENVEVHFIVAACENMVNGSAVHPGDIVKASNGKTIEINNTDAEGRLTLADALVYASELKPDAIVDLATLTGACVIALGDEIAGLWSDNEQLAIDLQKAADNSGEGLWRMPLQQTYKEGLKSMLADIKNTGPRAGGSITAALFLSEFVKDEIPWAHIDIAGPVWTDKDRGLNAAGATGFGVRTLTNWIIQKSS